MDNDGPGNNKRDFMIFSTGQTLVFLVLALPSYAWELRWILKPLFVTLCGMGSTVPFGVSLELFTA